LRGVQVGWGIKKSFLLSLRKYFEVFLFPKALISFLLKQNPNKNSGLFLFNWQNSEGFRGSYNHKIMKKLINIEGMKEFS